MGSNLNQFREIANLCDEQECIEIIEDCKESGHPLMQGPVKEIYEKRLESIISFRKEIDHYEEKFSQA